MSRIEIVQDTSKFKWAGTPFKQRYSQATPPQWLLKKMREYDDLVDLKFYLPTMKWHLVKHIGSRDSGKWMMCYELRDDPARGTSERLGEWLIGALRQGDVTGENKDFLENIEKNEAEKERNDDRKTDDICLETAERLRKPMQRLYDYGEK